VIDVMPRPRLPNLHREINRHGNVVWYVRIGKGPRTRIKAVYGTPEFETAYKAAINGDAPQAPTARSGVRPDRRPFRPDDCRAAQFGVPYVTTFDCPACGAPDADDYGCAICGSGPSG
jgi:hypothetical protein